jgi:hypothetical protein
VVIGVLALLFAGLVIFTGVARHWSVQTGELGSGGDSTTVTIATPLPGDLASVRRDLTRLAAALASPVAAPAHPRPATADRARSIRAGLIEWRDRFALTDHQTRVLDNAIAYAAALDRWLRVPQSAARHAAALRAWRAWRAADPGMRRT